VVILDLSSIKGVAFDIDGTLYRTWRLNVRMSFYFLRHNLFFLKYGLVRNIMHRTDAIPNFVQVQSEHMAKKLRTSPEEARARLDKIVYKEYSTTEIKVDDKDYIILKEEDVLATL